MTGVHPILVVDDDPDIRETLENVLEMYGWPVATASSGDAALEWLRVNPEPRMILLDLMMPGMDGFELRQQQLGDPTLASIPTVVLTGGSLTPRDRGRLGQVEVLVKPVTLPALLECLGRHGAA
ncbi:MAG: response regulator [Deltaproteobacteria bacterium]|nr:response regulator [Deltaproteobacteria bacterium]